MSNTTTGVKVQHPVIRHADGRRTRRGALSFFTIKLNRLGHWESEDLFDVPDENVSDGLVTGYRCAAELMAELKENGTENVSIIRLLEAVTKASQERGYKKGRWGAASAFMFVIAECMNFTAKHADMAKWLELKVAEAEKSRDFFEGLKAKERADFAVRMKAARQAKRLKPGAEVASHE